MNKKLTLKYTLLCFCISFALHTQAAGQQIENVDEAFEEARELAVAGNYQQARELAREILEITPDYHDVRILIARTYAWQEQWGPARAELNTVLQHDSNYPDALSALLDVEMWSQNFAAALPIANRLISLLPEVSGLYLKRAQIYAQLDRIGLAEKNLDEAARIDPDRRDVQIFRNQLESDRKRSMTALGLSYDYFDNGQEPWQRLYGEYHRFTKRGPVIARLNLHHRFEDTGIQFELDAYPAFGEKWYAYLNAGYSKSTLFPTVRFGGEMYRSFPGAFEGSLGIRFLSFSPDNVYIFTGSVNKYWRSWYFSARPFLNPQENGITTSMSVIARRYFGNPHTYATVNSGFGFSPDERRLLEGDPDRRFQKSQFIGLMGNYLFKNDLQLFGEVKATRTQQPVSTQYSTVYLFETGIRIRF